MREIAKIKTAKKFNTLKGLIFAGINFRGFRGFLPGKFSRGLFFADFVDTEFFAGINFRVFYRDIDGHDLKIRPKTLILYRFVNYFPIFFPVKFSRRFIFAVL